MTRQPASATSRHRNPSRRRLAGLLLAAVLTAAGNAAAKPLLVLDAGQHATAESCRACQPTVSRRSRSRLIADRFSPLSS